MSPTIGRHHHGSTRGQYPAVCSVCGVPWPRSKMQRTMGGLLVCPDDRGPDSATLDRLNARAAKRRQEPKAGPDLYLEPYSDPATILGDSLHSWWRPDSIQDVDIAGENFARRVYNRTDDTDLDGGTESHWPTFVHDRGSGRGAIVPGRATGTFTTQLAADSRPYFWCVVRGNGSGASTRFLLNLFGTTTSTVFTRNSSGEWHCHMRCSDGQENIDSNVAVDAGVHLLECGFLSSSAGRFRVDNTGYNGARTGGLLNAVTSIGLGDSSSSAWQAPVFEVVVASSIPTAAQLTAMRSYFTDLHTELDIA